MSRKLAAKPRKWHQGGLSSFASPRLTTRAKLGKCFPMTWKAFACSQALVCLVRGNSTGPSGAFHNRPATCARLLVSPGRLTPKITHLRQLRVDKASGKHVNRTIASLSIYFPFSFGCRFSKTFPQKAPMVNIWREYQHRGPPGQQHYNEAKSFHSATTARMTTRAGRQPGLPAMVLDESARPSPCTSQRPEHGTVDKPT